MEPRDFNEENELKEAIYSPQAVMGFTVVFGSLAGGILAAQSLQAAGQPEAAQRALWFGRGYFVFCLLLGYLLPPGVSGLGIGLGIGGGYWLSSYLKKHVPDEASYPRRSIVKPLIICLAVTAVFVATLVALLLS
ncbi:MAG: hypothetical protein ACRYFZ_05745 [Janthinobacterium lividum]